jgi:uncharacterized phiE125 gp8 family phage protein
MPYLQTTPPAIEPVLVEDIHLSSRIDDANDADDALIAALITTARQVLENECNRSFITQSWEYECDSFPGLQSVGALLIQRPYSLPDNALLLEKGPVQAVSAINYLDYSSTWNVWPSTNYVVDNIAKLCRITPIFGQIWPVTLPQISAINIEFTAGYGSTAAAVPAPLIQAIKMLTGFYYDNRNAAGSAKLAELPFGVKALIDPYILKIV